MKMTTVQQVAKSAGVSEMTILRHIRSGRLKATRFNRTYIIQVEDAQAFLDSYEPYDTLRKDK